MPIQRGVVALLELGLGTALASVGIWCWQRGTSLVNGRTVDLADAAHREHTGAVFRCGSVAMIALAQVVWMSVSVGRICHRDRFSDVFVALAAMVSAIAGVATVVLLF